MMAKKKEKKVLWYDNVELIINLVIGFILLIVVCSQSFALKTDSTLALLSSIINHNTVYILVLIYFIFLKTNFGKKYFNYFNLFLIVIYFISTLTSFLTVLQSFSLATCFSFMLNIVLFIYLTHTMLRDTRLWDDLKISYSPFNEVTNDYAYYICVVLSSLLLIVKLISTVVVSGVILSLLDSGFIILFSRYIFLYREYLDIKKLDSNNPGNFDEVKEKVKEIVTDAQETVKEVTEDATKKVVDFANETKEIVKEVTEETSKIINEHIEENKKDKAKEDTKKKGDK